MSTQFCRSCSNLLVPRENKADKKLVYLCPKCAFEAPAASPVAFKHEYIKSVQSQLEKVPDGMITDPALQRVPNECPKCAEVGAVFMMPPPAPNDDCIKLILVCTNVKCVFKWMV